MLIHNEIPVTLSNNLLTIRDAGKEIELKRDLLKMITNKNYNVDLAKLSDIKTLNDFVKEMFFDVQDQGNKFNRDRTHIKLLKTASSMISAAGISNTIFLPSDLTELGNPLKLLLQEKQAGNNPNINNDQIVAIVDTNAYLRNKTKF